MQRKAFTLIELLVVIAIIAILAAILFPVFAQAKLAAKKTQVLSNAKQIGTAQFMYENDFDDMSPSLGVGDWTDKLIPYVKNEELFLNPLRNDFDSGCLSHLHDAGFVAPTDEPGCRYVGFGYNWGPIKRRGGGMLGRQQPDPARPGNFYIPGISMTSIQSPADMFAYTVTYDTPRETMGIQFLLCTYGGAASNTGLFFGGQWPVAYADGHAKSMKWVGGNNDPAAEGGKWAVPSDLSKIVDYCADPSYLVDTSGDTGGSDGEESHFPTGTKCSDLPAIFASYRNGGGPTYFGN